MLIPEVYWREVLASLISGHTYDKQMKQMPSVPKQGLKTPANMNPKHKDPSYNKQKSINSV